MPFGLALTQLRHLGWRWVVAALGIALVASLPVVAASEATSVRRQVVAEAVTAMAPADRLIAATGSTADPRAVLADVTPTPAIAQLEFRQLSNRGETFLPAAVDDLSSRAHLLTGRWPTRCTPTRCEVLAVGPDPSAASLSALTSAVDDLGLDVVGTARITDPRVAAGPFDPGDTPLLLGTDIDGLRTLPHLTALTSHLDWISTLSPSRVAGLGVPAFLDRVQDAATELGSPRFSADLLITTAPLVAADDRADRATATYPLVDGLGLALIIGFAIVAAAGLNRDLRLLGDVLVRRGASTRQVRAVTITTLATVTLVGVLLGVVAGVGHGLLQDSSVAALGRSTLVALGLGLIALLTAVSVVLVPRARAGGLRRTVETAIVVALPAVALAAARGDDSGTDPLVWALPAAACLVAAVVAGRAWSLTRPLGRAHLPVAARLSLVQGDVLRPAATTALLAMAVATMVFAGGYSATLSNAAHDQAAWQVPTGVRVDAATGTPLTGSVPAPIVGLDGVLRTSGSVSPLPGVHDTVSVLGVPADLVHHMDRWRRTTGSSTSAAAVADALRGRSAQATYEVVGGTVRIGITGWQPDLAARLILRGSDGRAGVVALRYDGTALSGAAPAGGPWRVAALEVSEDPDHLQHRLHASGEGVTDVAPPSGRLTIGGGLGLPARTYEYRLDGSPLVIAPGTVPAVPVAVDAATAALARGGTFTLNLGAPITVRVVKILPRLPTASDRFVLADRDTLTAAIDAVQPGLQITELWGRDPTPAITSLAGVTTQEAVARTLREDPAARGGRQLLTWLGYGGLGLAGLAVILLVVAERREGATVLFSWEAEGVTPRTLRAMLVTRPVLVTVIALPVGLVAGIALVRGVATLIAVEAWGRSAQPPLIAVTGHGAVVAILGAIVSVLVAALCATVLLREPFPRPAEVDRR